MRPSGVRRRNLLRVDPVSLYGFDDLDGREPVLVGERLQCRDGHKMTIDLKVAPKLAPEIRAPEPIGAESAIGPAQIRSNLLGKQLHVVSGGDDRAIVTLQCRVEVWNSRLLERMESVPPLYLLGLTSELREARDAPNVRGNTEVFLQQFSAGDHPRSIAPLPKS